MAASNTYGLTPTGFVVKQQNEIITELNAAFQAALGANINLLPEAVLGQLIGIVSERETLVWQLAEAVYDSQYPDGAEGTSVDNILALNNMRRLPATPTVTDPNALTQANGIVLYGLVLYGTPGTVVPAGSVIQTGASPPVQFTLDSSVTIQPAVNAVQNVYLSNSPTQGAFSLSVADPAGNTLTTEAIQWNAPAAQSLLGFSTVPVVSSGFSLTLTLAGAALTTGTISTNGVYPAAADIQSAIQALAGYSAATVSGSNGSYTVSWGSSANPLVTVASNTTGATITPVDSVQAAVNNLYDSTESNYPYTDVQVSVGASGFAVAFGSGTVVAGQPASGSQPQALMLVASNSLQNGATVTNVEVVGSVAGAPAQGVGSATCTVDGPNFVAAGTLNVIGTAVNGWSSVDNQLDCITGTNVETDTAALLRRAQNLSGQGNGPLASIVTKVQAVSGVVTALGFENLNEAALQQLAFSVTPSSGSYNLVVNGYQTASLAYNATAAQVQAAINALPGLSAVLVTGTYQVGYTIDFNGSFGGQPMALIEVSNDTTGSSLGASFGRPGKSFEIVVNGGDDVAIAQAILDAKPAGIQTYGSVTKQVFDADGNAYNISFSRPTEVAVYVVLSLQTDLLVAASPQFNPGSIPQIQDDIIAAINAVGIGGLLKGFGSDGIIGAFNSVPGIDFYTLYFGTSPNPSTNTNIQLQPEQVAVAETFNVVVSYV